MPTLVLNGIGSPCLLQIGLGNKDVSEPGWVMEQELLTLLTKHQHEMIDAGKAGSGRVVGKVGHVQRAQQDWTRSQV